MHNSAQLRCFENGNDDFGVEAFWIGDAARAGYFVPLNGPLNGHPLVYIALDSLYGCESWLMTKQSEQSIEEVEMFLRRIMTCIQKTTNVEIINIASSRRKGIRKIKIRQAKCLDHVMRNIKLNKLFNFMNIERNARTHRHAHPHTPTHISERKGYFTAPISKEICHSFTVDPT